MERTRSNGHLATDDGSRLDPVRIRRRLSREDRRAGACSADQVTTSVRGPSPWGPSPWWPSPWSAWARSVRPDVDHPEVRGARLLPGTGGTRPLL